MSAASISLKSYNSGLELCIITIPICKLMYLGMRNLMRAIKTVSVKAAILKFKMAAAISLKSCYPVCKPCIITIPLCKRTLICRHEKSNKNYKNCASQGSHLGINDGCVNLIQCIKGVIIHVFAR